MSRLPGLTGSQFEQAALNTLEPADGDAGALFALPGCCGISLLAG